MSGFPLLRRPYVALVIRMTVLFVVTCLPLAFLGLRPRDPGWPLAQALLGVAPWLDIVLGLQVSGLMISYLGAVYASVLVYYALPPRFRGAALAALSLLYFAAQISFTLSWRFLIGMIWFWAVLRVSSARARLVLFAGWLLAFYSLAPMGEIFLLDGARSLGGGGAENLVAIGLFVRTFRRGVFAFFEVHKGRVTAPSLVTVLNYQIGLPFLVGHSATPSLKHFIDTEARTEDALAASWRAGLANALVCYGCLLAWMVLIGLRSRAGVTIIYDQQYALHRATRIDLWKMILGWHFWYYLRRMSTEQMSVATWRLFGHNMKDDFAKPLRSPSVVEYWRRWNALWREFLVSWIYYPVVMRLARRHGHDKAWIYGVSGFLTFMGGTLFDFFPRILFFVNGFDQEVLDFMFSLLLYHVSWSCCLGVSLYLQAKRRGRPIGAGWLLPLQIALTYTIASLCRVWEIPWLSVGDKLHMLWRAFAP